ncbi:hypothetical protein ACFP6A_04165 [Quadrisphaera sp. GCM10027208]|uniref:hypothetical protein n=1 Tax=Quadrisphaera sp. GCM10027208 TaxID=3273423 RepID=UPI00360EE3C9
MTAPDPADVTDVCGEVWDAERTSELWNNDEAPTRAVQVPNGSERILMQLAFLDWLETTSSPRG